MISKKVDLEQLEESKRGHASTYSTRYFTESVPKYEIPKRGMPANAAYQLVKDELSLDGNPAVNHNYLKDRRPSMYKPITALEADFIKGGWKYPLYKNGQGISIESQTPVL